MTGNTNYSGSEPLSKKIKSKLNIFRQHTFARGSDLDALMNIVICLDVICLSLMDPVGMT